MCFGDMFALLTRTSKYLSLLQHVQYMPENHEMGAEDNSEKTL